ncbi:oligosaccharide flippase family protein [Aeromonas caviae]|uniref:oligosaccharide flippase family protein n=1 Tax=Aeromonas caviae TaxID=648 RepID=UPI00403F779E
MKKRLGSVSEGRVYKNIVFLLLVQFSNYIAPLLVLPYLTRVLGIEKFGVFVIVMSMTSIAMILTDFGFNLSGTHWVARHHEQREQVAKYLGSVTLIKFFLALVSSIGVVLYSWLIPQAGFSNILLFSIFFVIFSQAFQLTWFFQGIEKMKNITISLVTAKILYMILVFSLVRGAEDIHLVLYSLAGSNIIASLIGTWLLKKAGYRFAFPSIKLVWKVFFSSVEFFMSRAAVGLYTSASAFIVGSVCGAQQAALYFSAEKLYQAGQGVTTSVTQALYPYLTRTPDVKVFYRVITFLILPLLMGCSTIYFFSSDVLSFFYGQSFSQASDILRVFLICSVVTFIGINFGYPAFSMLGRIDIANKTVLWGAALQLVSLIVMYRLEIISAINVCYSVLLVESVVMLLRVSMFYYLIRNVK